MEKQLDDLSIFEEYRDRQVILNYYQDDDFLSKRDGFHFVSIQFADGQLLFFKNDGNSTAISLQEFQTRVINSDFQNYYVCRNGRDRLEIYFP
ncbi:hypothetical protein FAY30_11320 [Bacillus sp. S3]|uniref:hypothetical protein n=1 Tax=Bacillus sp. S3 TaxID=486398 RepID=UPI001188BC0D|nr:hypothetical protein [Bacillus sp. S3]QCJ42455.1 hypothetical protein FAY30_11320 [Bacillus sp. S3]